jgi:hypothetical protein
MATASAVSDSADATAALVIATAALVIVASVTGGMYWFTTMAS